MKNLTITREKLNALIEFDQEISERHDEEETLISAIESIVALPTDTSKRDFKDAVKELSAEESREILALISLGGGNFSSFKAAYENAAGFDNVTSGDFEGLTKHIRPGIELAEKEGIRIN